MAASVGDSLLDSIGANGDGDGAKAKQNGAESGYDLEGVASWADPTLPPDQVAVLSSATWHAFVSGGYS